MKTRVIGMIIMAGVIVQIILGELDLLSPSMTNPITLIHGAIGISGLGLTLFMTNRALKISQTPITKYVMILASLLVLGQVATGGMLLTGMSTRVSDHAMTAYVIVFLLVGHVVYAINYAKKQKQ
ncbi:MAG: hypothetical protein ATL_00020 [Thaumarchaeota archaeon]|jgi:hypothetical protein|nr:hypothetical protein [Nitrososphaerota archaeon]